MSFTRIAATLAGTVVVASAAFAGTATAQEAPVDPEVTTTTEAPVVETTTTTTEAPAPAEPAAEPEVTTTTVAPAAPLEVELFGDTVAAGQLDVAIGWMDSPQSNCVETIDLATSGQVNAVADDDGNLGAVYGMANSAGGNAAVLIVGFGALPLGVAVVSIDDAACSVDAVGVGNVTKDAQRLRIDGVGAGMHSANYAAGEYANSFVVDARVSAVTTGATLDLAAAQAFLERPRG